MLVILIKSLRMLLVLTILTGGIYPVVVTAIGQALFSDRANGSLLERADELIGSTLIAQEFASARYFHARPSAAHYQTLPSGASNLGPTSTQLRDAVADRRMMLGDDAPSDLLTTSASGLDPHISPEAAYFQADRVLAARGIPEIERAEVTKLVEDHIEGPQFGFLGRPRVNVLLLNIALDQRFP